MKRIDDVVGELKGEVSQWEEGIFDWACGLAQALAKVVLERIDEALLKGRGERGRAAVFCDQPPALQATGHRFGERTPTRTDRPAAPERRLQAAANPVLACFAEATIPERLGRDTSSPCATLLLGQPWGG